MMYDVQLSERAEKDIRGIYEYIAFDLQSPIAASGQLDRLEEAIYKLDHMPNRFRRYDKEPWRSRGLRLFAVDNYAVFYIPDVVKKQVTVIRVMYGGRDIDSELRRYTGA